MAWLSGIGGLLILLLVCLFCAALAPALQVEASVLPLPVLGAAALWLLGFGYAGVLHLGLLLCYAVVVAAMVYLAVRAGKQAFFQALQSPGLVLVMLGGCFLWGLFSVLQPMFTQWDEFTLWGTAAKMLKSQNMLYCAAPGNLAARAGMPAMALLSYFFQGLSDSFSEWQCLAVYDILFLAAAAAASTMPRKKAAHSILLLGAGVLLPFFFSAIPAGAVSTVFASAMGDVPLAVCFGGSVCVFLVWGRRPAGLVATGLCLGFLTAVKDMGFAYALIAVFVIWLDLLILGAEEAQTGPGGKKSGLRVLGGSLGRAALLCVPVLAVFVSWSRYYAMVTAGGAKESVGSAGLSYGQILSGGAAQLLGIGRTERFASLMQNMAQAFFTRRVCVLGSGAVAVAAITLVALAAWLLAGRGAEQRAQRRRVPVLWLGFALCFVAFYLFHLILYYYNFAEVEAAQLKDYERYIGPYYLGWMLASLCLLGRTAAEGARQKLAGLALAGAAVCVMVAVFWRGLPTAGFYSRDNSITVLRRDVQQNAAQANRVLGWNDRVLVLSQGDDATRWYYYNYELNATVVKGFGGRFNGEDRSARWDSTFMNLVESLNWTLYDYQAVCTPQGLAAYVREKDCDYLMLDRADAYMEREFSPLFVGGLTADMPATLYRVTDPSPADPLGVRFVAAESEAAQ